MTTKEKLKKEIDKLPNNLTEQVYKFIISIKLKNPKQSKVRSFKLKGQFDNLNTPKKAYE